MDERIELLKALYTNRAIRRFRQDPITDSVISKVIESATQAPNGSNQQRWRFLVIRDPGVRRQVGDVYRRAMDELVPAEKVAKDTDSIRRRVWEAGRRLAQHIGTEPPILIMVCQEGSSIPSARPVDTLYATRSRGSSIYPAVQNLLLAARAYGLGGCLTATHLIYEEEIKEILGIPAHISTFALIPLGYPQDRFGPVRRRPVDEVIYLDRWGAPFAAGGAASAASGHC